MNGGIAPYPFLSIYFRYDTYFIKDKHTFVLFFIIFGVREAASYLNFLGNISIGSELPVSISEEPVPSATLANHLELAFQKPKTACFFILNGNTVVFIPLTPNYVLLIDSHLHGQTGAFVALCERRHIYELLTWYKSFNNFQYSLGTVTQVTFI